MDKPKIVIVLLTLYILLIYLLISYNFIDITGYQGPYIFMMLLGGYLLFMIYVWSQTVESSYRHGNAPPLLSFITKCLGFIGFFILLMLFIWSFVLLLTTYPAYTTYGLIFLTICYIYYTYRTKSTNTYTSSSNTISNKIMNLFTTLINKINFKEIFRLIIICGVILLFYFWQYVYKFLFFPSGQVLINKPVNLSSQQKLGYYENLSTEQNNLQTYRYSLSSWIYINYQGLNMNSSYNKLTTLLNYGNKPNIMYKASSNNISVIFADKIIYTSEEINMNKWNNFVINYDSGTLDLFINGELVCSVYNDVPYINIDEVTSGADNGIYGGICNVVYYGKLLSKYDILFNYEKYKNKSPPSI